MTDEQAAAYAAYGGAPSRMELERFFFLDDVDRELIEGKRRSYNRLGFAVQMTSARYLGVFLEDLTDVAGGGRRLPRRAARHRRRVGAEGVRRTGEHPLGARP